MTWNIIENGTTAFWWIIDKLGDIATEFVPYIIYIAIAIISIACTISIVKSILRIAKQESMKIWRERRERRDTYYANRARAKYRRELIEYAKHWYNVEDERKAMWFWRYHW